MSSQDIQKLKAHFLTSQQWEGKSNPAADELWFVKMPHWLKYAGAGCLTITTQPTASGSEINFYSGASVVVHCGKYADGTNNNRIVEITADKYVDVASYSSGAYCFDSSGNMVVGNSITYDDSTNLVSIDGVSGNYSQPIQTFTYDSSMNEVTLNGTVSVKGLGGGGSAEFNYNAYNETWYIKFGNVIMQGGSFDWPYQEYNYSLYFPEPLANSDYYFQIYSPEGSYYTPYVNSKYSTYVYLGINDAYSSSKCIWMVIGEC